VWDDETSYLAATAGHLECLQYLLAVETLDNNEMEAATTMADMATRDEKMKRSSTSRGVYKRKHKCNTRWTQEEEDALCEGVRAHGVGKWSKIWHASETLQRNRTNIDLKDKWRNIEKREGKRTPPEVFRRWTQEEEDALRAGVDKHGRRWAAMKNDPTSSQILKNHSPQRMKAKWCNIEKREGKRTTPQVYRRWTQDEEDALRAGVDKHGRRWMGIKNDPTFSQILKNRSRNDMSQKWREIEKREGKRTTPRACMHWTQEEEDALRAGVDKHGRRWEGIQNDPTFSQILKNRSRISTRKRWCDIEKREGKRTPRVFRRWTQEEEDALRAGVDKHGRRWAAVKNDPTFSQILKNRSLKDMSGKRRYL
jgi:hypothetical protein